jgi:hypothetical protein
MARESDFTPLFTIPRWSFDLRQLFLWTAMIALGLVALRSASTMWAASMLALTLAILASSILLAIFRRGAQRAYWIGFATIGWLYLLLLLASWTLGRTTANDSPLRAHNLLTQQLSSRSYHWLYDNAFNNYRAASYASSGYGAPPGIPGEGLGPDDGSTAMMSGGGMSAPYGMGANGPLPGPVPGPNEGDFVNVAIPSGHIVRRLGGTLSGFTRPARSGRLAAGLGVTIRLVTLCQGG